MHNIKIPNRIQPGDKIGICAPSGSFDIYLFNKGVDIIKKMGFEVYIPDDIYIKKRYLAGEDIKRAETINNLFKDESIKGILCARGGFGAMRVLPFLDYDIIKNNPKIFVGFSDVTAILLTLQKKCFFSVFHGPVVTSLAYSSRETLDSFFNILTEPSLSLITLYSTSELSGLSEFSPLTDGLNKNNGKTGDNFYPLLEKYTEKNSNLARSRYILLKNGITIRRGHACGIFSGGNLATIAHLTGTPFQPDFNDCIFFLEDTGETPYKIDRMLTQMKMSGVFKGIKGVIAGSFKDCGNEKMIFEILDEIFENFHIPVVAGLKAGHGNINLTIPLGVEITMNA